MTDRVESGTPDDNSTGPTKDPRSADDSQDCPCVEARTHLEAFLDHKYAVDLAKRLAQHVATCSHCSRFANAEAHLRGILYSRCAEQAPLELRVRVLGHLSALHATAVNVMTTSTTTWTQTSASERIMHVAESRVGSSRTVHFERD